MYETKGSLIFPCPTTHMRKLSGDPLALIIGASIFFASVHKQSYARYDAKDQEKCFNVPLGLHHTLQHPHEMRLRV